MADIVTIPYVSSLHIKQFRCFEEQTFLFTAPIVLVEGSNGSGKTSLVEALHFVCYVRSFRATTPRDLVLHDQSSFFIRITIVQNYGEDSIQAGFSGSRRLVKVNDQTVTSYKQLIDHYRVITVTEDDLGLIKEGPALRRQFIDQAMGIQNPVWSEYLKKALALIEQRSHALYMGNCTSALYEAWTESIWNFSQHIELKRKEYLVQLECAVQNLLKTTVFSQESLTIQLSYKPKKSCMYETYQQFSESNPQLYYEEVKLRRSLFGFNLDDIEIQISGRNARHYASRGQQKLALLLLKAAQISILPQSQGPTLIILDDFITDLDEQRMIQLLQLFMSMGTQLILTTPRKDPVMHKVLSQSQYSYQTITLE